MAEREALTNRAQITRKAALFLCRFFCSTPKHTPSLLALDSSRTNQIPPSFLTLENYLGVFVPKRAPTSTCATKPMTGDEVVRDMLRRKVLPVDKVAEFQAWWEVTWNLWVRNKTSASYFRSTKGQAKKLKGVAQAGEKWLAKLKEPELRVELITARANAMNRRDADNPIGDKFPSAQKAIDATITDIESILAELNYRCKNELIDFKMGPNKEFNDIIAKRAFTFWTDEIKGSANFRDPRFVTFVDVIFKGLREVYSKGGSLESQLRRWLGDSQKVKKK